MNPFSVVPVSPIDGQPPPGSRNHLRRGRLRRFRPNVCVMLAVVIASGLASRRYPRFVPGMLHDYPGDALWAMAAYWGVVLLWPRISIGGAALSAAVISLAVELSQIYHAEWIDAIRRTLFGRLVLGSGFDWIDLVAYAAGTILAAIMDRWFLERSGQATERIEK